MMTVRIPVYEHTFGNGIAMLKTTDARLVADPDCPMMIELIGYIIAPEGTLPWETGNGIDVFATKETLDLAVAMYYAEKNCRSLSWKPSACFLVAVNYYKPFMNGGTVDGNGPAGSKPLARYGAHMGMLGVNSFNTRLISSNRAVPSLGPNCVTRLVSPSLIKLTSGRRRYNGCTNIPLSAGRAQDDEASLCGRHFMPSAVSVRHLDPPGFHEAPVDFKGLSSRKGYAFFITAPSFHEDPVYPETIKPGFLDRHNRIPKTSLSVASLP